MIKRKTAILLVLLMIINSIQVCTLAAPYLKLSEARAGFEGNAVYEKGLKVQPGGNGENVSYGLKNGKYGWLIDPNTIDNNARHLYVDVDNEYIYNLSDYKTVRIDVEYYDSGDGTFLIQYNNYSGKLSWTEYTEPTYTNSWKKHTFYISDCAFTDNRNKKYDFSLSVDGGNMGRSLGSILVGSITVTLSDEREHIIIEAANPEKMGRFYTGDTANLEFNFSNTERVVVSDGRYPVDVSYEVLDQNGKIIYSQRKILNLGYGKTVRDKISVSLETYGLYQVKVRAENREYKVFGEKEHTFGYIHSVKGKYLNPRSSIIGEVNRSNVDIYTYAGIGNVRVTAAGTRDFHIRGNDYRIAPKFREELRVYPQNGIDVTVCLMNYGRQLAFSTGEKTPISDKALAEWAEFCRKTVRQLKGVTNVFELWNEYDISGGAFNPDSGTAKDYARMAEVSYKAIKEENPDAVVLTLSTSGGSSGFPGLSFIEEAFDAGIGEWSDGVAIHPYYWYDAPKEGDVYQVVRDGVRKIMDNHNMQDKPIYATEVGWATNYYGVTPEEQGYYNVQNYVIYSEKHNNKPLIDVISTYRVIDSSNYYRNDRESNFGLLHKNTPKPAYLAISNMNVLLADAECMSAMSVHGDTSYVYRFDSSKHRNTQTLVMWSSADTDTVRLNLGIDEVTVFDVYGNAQKVKGNDGKYTFTLTDAPVYVEGDFKEVNETETGALAELSKEVYTVSAGGNLKLEFNSIADDKLDIQMKFNENVFEVLENTGVQNGRGYVLISAGNPVKGEEKIIIKAFNKDGDCVTNTEAMVVFKNPAELYLTKHYDAAEKQWYLVGNITNNTEEEICGSLRVIMPDNLAASMQKINDVKVDAGDTASVELKIPHEFTYAESEVSALFDMNNSLGADADIRLAFETAGYSEQKPVIDGKLDEASWNNCAAVTLSEREQFTDEITLTGDYGGMNDICAEIRLMWDNEMLYLGAVVTDDVHNQKGPVGSLWKYDSIQLGASYDPKNELESTDFFEIALGMLNDGSTQMQQYANGLAVNGDNSGVIAKVVRDEKQKTTTYEAAFPWSLVSSNRLNNAQADTELKISILINEADSATRKGYYEFGSGISNGKNSNLFKIINMIKN